MSNIYSSEEKSFPFIVYDVCVMFNCTLCALFFEPGSESLIGISSNCEVWLHQKTIEHRRRLQVRSRGGYTVVAVCPCRIPTQTANECNYFY